MGESFVTYLQHVRIAKAKQLLTDPSLRVYEVAEAVGFHNATYFTTTFRKVTGMSVTEYRKGTQAVQG